MTPIEPLQVSEVVERLDLICEQIVLHHNLRGSRTLAATGAVSIWSADTLREEAIAAAPVALASLRTLQSENEALRAAGEEARRALDSFSHIASRFAEWDVCDPEVVLRIERDDDVLSQGKGR